MWSTCHGPSQLSVLYLAVESFTARDGATYWQRLRILPTLPAFDAPLGGHRRNIAIKFGMEKLEWWVYQMVKKVSEYVYSFRQTPGRTDGQTDGRTLHDGIGHACIASHGKNDMCTQLSLFLHFYLLYILSNSIDGSDATQVTWSTSNWHMGVGQAYHKTSSTKLLVNGESGYHTCMPENKRTSLWTSAKLKLATNSLRRKTRYVLRHFRRSYLKANKVSKNEGTKNFNVHIIFESVPMLLPQIIKISPCLPNYSLPKLAHFWDTVYKYTDSVAVTPPSAWWNVDISAFAAATWWSKLPDFSSIAEYATKSDLTSFSDIASSVINHITVYIHCESGKTGPFFIWV